MSDDSTTNVVEIKTGPKRDAKGRILPGQSLNPEGGNKPKLFRVGSSKYELADLYRDSATRVFAELVKLILDPDTVGSTRVSAIKEFNDRHLGRPAQTTTLRRDEDSGTGLDLSSASSEFLEELTRLKLGDE